MTIELILQILVFPCLAALALQIHAIGNRVTKVETKFEERERWEGMHDTEH